MAAILFIFLSFLFLLDFILANEAGFLRYLLDDGYEILHGGVVEVERTPPHLRGVGSIYPLDEELCMRKSDTAFPLNS